MRIGLFFLMFLLSLVFLASACNSNDKVNASIEVSPAARQGERVFKMQCSICHYTNSRQVLHGPGLQGVFKRQELPSGVKASDEHVKQTIQNGRNMMPPFRNVLDDQQISDLLAYLHTL